MTQETKGTKLFGKNIPVSPKILLSGLFTVALLLAFYNFFGGSDETTANTVRPAVKPQSGASAATPASNLSSIASARRTEANNKNKQGVLKLKPVDPASVLDPTLKLALLDRVRSVKLAAGGRNLFEGGTDPVQMAANLPSIPKVAPMPPKPIEPVGPQMPPPKPPPPPLNVPLRYYGFVRPSLRGDGNRGYFMDGDTILMATEGDVLKSRFLIVALSPNTAHVEDIQLKQGQDLPLIPEALVMNQ